MIATEESMIERYMEVKDTLEMGGRKFNNKVAITADLNNAVLKANISLNLLPLSKLT